MASPYIGEIRMFAGNFAPNGWLHCEGQLLPISEYEALFFLIGTTYGGDGQSTFALPDLRGRLPLHQGLSPGGSTYQVGEMGGTETVIITVNQIPAHTHSSRGTSAEGDRRNPAQALFAKASEPAYAPGGGVLAPMAAVSTSVSGGSQPHDNMQPYLCIHFIISLYGIFPSQA